MNIPILSPHINESGTGFTATDNGIRFGLAAVRNVGNAAVKAILDASEAFGPFTSLHYFLMSVDLRCVNKQVVASLIDAGAFDSIGPNHATMQASLPSALAYAQAIQEERIKGQTTLFGGVGVDPAVHIPPPDYHYIQEFPLEELQSREKTMLGYYVTSHPLSAFKNEIEHLASHRLGEIDEVEDGASVRLCGVITSARNRKTKSGEYMTIIHLEDLTGEIEGLVFASKLSNGAGEYIKNEALVGVMGKISRQSNDEEAKLRVDEVIPLERAMERWGHILRLRVSRERLSDLLITRLKETLALFPGSCRVLMDITMPTGGVKVFRLDKFLISPATELINRLNEILGEDSVIVSR